MSVQSIYENMLKNPKNRARSTIKQPTPFDGHDKVVPTAKKVKEEDVIDDSFLRSIDERMARKNSGTSNTIVESATFDKVAKLEKRIDELEELVTIMMKQQMKLLENRK
jgi:hypothetical protein